ncbi:dienelactone hydrolase [Jannaschia pagri]|uniref:Dienelactone hydrolase n=1 Tax=Jannaschia pagri TaxID=2829797 RepID=A0ABQ4NI93_9RHOB|nr:MULTISPECIES: alpha/beta fold hydrolase [unclassified Jannaschia]GIT89749.1 dienelactone hydrolase [Jannaschia sp. AI_61]GIT94143.1 dienelactone hydrolase [Jannaschia sp. AI_62]
MRSLIALAAAAVSVLPLASAAEPVGYDRIDLAAAHRAWPVQASVWYPVGSRTYRGLVGDNPVFRGTPVYVGAGIAEGRRPLVLFSHGSGGNMDGMGWLLSGLAEAGAMVLAVNHPGSTSGDSSPRRSIRLDKRAADLSAALDALLADPVFAAHVDPNRIAAVGFSLGGATALGMGGLRYDGAVMAEVCTDQSRADCSFFAKGGVDFTGATDGFEADMRDSRVTSVVAIDPGFTAAATEASIAAMDVPVHVVTLGEAHRLPAADVSASGSNLIARLPMATLDVVAPASHFTALAPCKPVGVALLAEEGEDPVCTDPPGADRAAVHRSIIASVVQALGL